VLWFESLIFNVFFLQLIKKCCNLLQTLRVRTSNIDLYQKILLLNKQAEQSIYKKTINKTVVKISFGLS